MRIMVTGARGMLGSDIMARLEGVHEAVGVDMAEFDILDEIEVRTHVADIKPDWIIHCAAFTNVDGCEKEPDKAHAVNVDGARNVARAGWGVRSRMLYVSTDYVYDGKKKGAYVETDEVGPMSVYGKTKLDGEREVLSAIKNPLIVRTSWLFGLGGHNFVEAILGQVGKKDELGVVDDQVGSPTYTPDLADALTRLIEADATGIVHVSNEGRCSWYEYAKKTLELAGITGIEVKPITTRQLGRPAPRPANSVLSKERYVRLTGHRLRGWEDALAEYIAKRAKAQA